MRSVGKAGGAYPAAGKRIGLRCGNDLTTILRMMTIIRRIVLFERIRMRSPAECSAARAFCLLCVGAFDTQKASPAAKATGDADWVCSALWKNAAPPLSNQFSAHQHAHDGRHHQPARPAAGVAQAVQSFDGGVEVFIHFDAVGVELEFGRVE